MSKQTTHLASPFFYRTRCGLRLAGLPALERLRLVKQRPTCKTCARSLAAAKKAGLR